MDRDQFTDTLTSFVRTFVDACDDINTSSGGISRTAPFEGEYIDIGMRDIDPNAFEYAMHQLIRNNPALAEGVYVERYSDRSILLHLKADEGVENVFEGQFAQMLHSAMQGEIESPTINRSGMDTSCLQAEFQRAGSGTEVAAVSERIIQPFPAASVQT